MVHIVPKFYRHNIPFAFLIRFKDLRLLYSRLVAFLFFSLPNKLFTGEWVTKINRGELKRGKSKQSHAQQAINAFPQNRQKREKEKRKKRKKRKEK